MFFFKNEWLATILISSMLAPNTRTADAKRAHFIFAPKYVENSHKTGVAFSVKTYKNISLTVTDREIFVSILSPTFQLTYNIPNYQKHIRKICVFFFFPNTFKFGFSILLL